MWRGLRGKGVVIGYFSLRLCLSVLDQVIYYLYIQMLKLVFCYLLKWGGGEGQRELMYHLANKPRHCVFLFKSSLIT